MRKKTPQQRADRLRQLSGKSHQNFRANFKAIRLRLGLTQDELARHIGISRTYIADLERGRNCPSLDIVDWCAKGLGVKPNALTRDVVEKIVRNPP